MVLGGDSDTTEDRLLGGRVLLRQPASGYRAATDPILLAACVPARAGERVLDLGAGVGSVGLCLAARVPVAVQAVELDPGLARLARFNAKANEADMAVWHGDIRALPPEIRQGSYDHVVTNPPWHLPEALASPDPVRDRANRETDVPLREWLALARARVAPRGTLSVIQRTERLPDCLAPLEGYGRIDVLPIAARDGRAAKRVIVQLRKGGGTGFRLLAPLVMHQGDRHVKDHDDWTETARAILSGMAPIDLRP